MPFVSDIFARKLHEALQSIDDAALFHVTHDHHGSSILDDSGTPIKGQYPRGGPFCAMLAIRHKDNLEIIGEPRGNNVLSSGIASKHAEDQALLPDNYQALVIKLEEYKKAGEEVSVWMITSGQSCTTCHTKQEIIARDLINRGLIQNSCFTTLYGATYDETFRIAQFYDVQYADAMILFAREPENDNNLIHSQKVDYEQIPQEVQRILSQALKSTAVIVRHGKVYSVGTDHRSEFDLNSTAEISAVRAACIRHREEGAFISWEVDGILYTTSSQVGPLLFSEMGWTKIKYINHVIMPEELKHKQFDTLETPEITNAEFLRIVAGGYHHERSAIIVLRDGSFVNTAQPMWARVLEVNSEVLYNGAAVSDVVLAERDIHTRFLFAAQILCVQGTKPRQLIPLASLYD